MTNDRLIWPRKTRDLHNHHFDSTIWNDFVFRDDDIVPAVIVYERTSGITAADRAEAARDRAEIAEVEEDANRTVGDQGDREVCGDDAVNRQVDGAADVLDHHGLAERRAHALAERDRAFTQFFILDHVEHRQRAGDGPDAEVPGWYYNLGRTGLRVELVAEAPTHLVVRHVFADSAATGRVEVGDHIVGVAGQRFATGTEHDASVTATMALRPVMSAGALAPSISSTSSPSALKYPSWSAIVRGR